MIKLIGIELPEVKPGDDIGRLICERAELEDCDVVVVASKIVSKAEGRLVKVDDITPSKEAERLARKTGKPAELVELIMRNSEIVGVIPVFSIIKEGAVDAKMLSEKVETAAILERDKSLLVTLVGKSVYTDAGIDFSNAPAGYAVLPPENPNESARRIRESIMSASGRDVAVLISDTEAFVGGSIEVCRGYAGICPVKRSFGEEDIYGRAKYGGSEALAHEICCAASLLMGQAKERIPVVVVRGLRYERDCDFQEMDLEKAFRIIVRENARLLGVRGILLNLFRIFLRILRGRKPFKF